MALIHQQLSRRVT